MSDGVTAGAMLRQAREAAGLHVAALAVSLKVPVRKLEALEEDRFDLMPDNVFVRALASSVCRTLKIDPQPIMERLPQNTAPRLVRDNEGINTPFRAPSDGAPPSWFDQLTRPVFLGVFALLFGALILILLPTKYLEGAVGGGDKSGGEKTEAVIAPIVVPPPVAETVKMVTVAVPTPAPAIAVVKPAPVPLPAAAVASAPAMTKPAIAPASAPAASTAALPAAAASGIVVFRAKGPTWVEVTDAKGAVPIRKVLIAGEALGVGGALPLKVTVGRIDLTDVQVRGKPFDLRKVSTDNVARFEVK